MQITPSHSQHVTQVNWLYPEVKSTVDAFTKLVGHDTSVMFQISMWFPFWFIWTHFSLEMSPILKSFHKPIIRFLVDNFGHFKIYWLKAI